MAKFIKLGNVALKQAPKQGLQISLGGKSAKNKSESGSWENYSVTVTVKDAAGNVVASVDNPYLQVRDPRVNNPNADRIPDFIRQELTLVVSD